MNKALFSLSLFLTPVFSWALLTGGAQDRAELKKIEKLVPQMARSCPLKVEDSQQLRQLVARNLLFNETSCAAQYLVEWDKNEDFPSLGLPHAIWFPAGGEKVVDESFPELWQFLRLKAKASAYAPKIPAWLDKDDIGAAPWTSADDFKQKMKADSDLQQLANFLRSPTVLEWQAEFSVNRGLQSAYKVLAASALENPSLQPSATLCQNLKNLLATDQGTLAIVDYVNFKGEGLDPAEVRGSQNYRWGLKQVVEKMNQYPGLANEKFAKSAYQALYDLAYAFEDTKARDLRLMWLKGGWGTRIQRTYVDGGIDPAQCPMIPSGGATRASATGAK